MKFSKNGYRVPTQIVLILLIASLVSCTSSEQIPMDSANSTDELTTTELQIMPNLPDKTWDGEAFTIYCRYGDGSRSEIADTVYLEEASGDVLDDAVFARMRNVSERFCITFDVHSPNDDPFGQNLQNTIIAGDDTYDLVIPHASFSIQYAQNGLALDWNELPYVDFSNPWWSSDAAENLNIGNKIYIVADDITHNSLAETQAMVFVKEYLTDVELDYPYELVKNGEWTLDKLNEYASLTSRDLNGDTRMTLDDDQFGYITPSWTGPVSVLCNAGIRICEVDNDGMVQLTINSPRTAEVFDRYFTMMNEPYAYIDPTLADEVTTMAAAFRSGHAAFMPTTLMMAESLRDMDQEFGIIPIPKYDKSVDGYPTLVDGGASMLIVPVTVRDHEMVSAVLEAMSWENYQNVLPAYYEKVLKSKAATDSDSAEMIDIIRAGRVFDVGYYYTGGAFQYIGHHLAKSSDHGFASYYAANEASVLAKIDEINQLFNE